MYQIRGGLEAHYAAWNGAWNMDYLSEELEPEFRERGVFIQFVMPAYLPATDRQGALAGTPQDSNLYLDSVLRDHLPGNVRSLNLDPATLPELKVKVKATFITNRELKAELRNGAVHGLSTVLRRRGDCSAPGYQGPNVTVGCNVNLDGVSVSYEVKAKGHNFAGVKTKYNLVLYVQNTNVFVEVTSWPPQAGVLKTLTLGGVDLRLVHGKSLGLNKKRQQAYDEELKRSVQGALVSLIYGKFRDALNLSVSRVAMPRV